MYSTLINLLPNSITENTLFLLTWRYRYIAGLDSASLNYLFG